MWNALFLKLLEASLRSEVDDLIVYTTAMAPTKLPFPNFKSSAHTVPLLCCNNCGCDKFTVLFWCRRQQQQWVVHFITRRTIIQYTVSYSPDEAPISAARRYTSRDRPTTARLDEGHRPTLHLCRLDSIRRCRKTAACGEMEQFSSSSIGQSLPSPTHSCHASWRQRTNIIPLIAGVPATVVNCTNS